MQQEIDAAEAVSRAVDRITRKGRFAEFELSNGIILNVKPVPPHLVIAVQNEFHMPLPPKVMIEEKGREEENPNDPAYQREVEELIVRQTLAINDLYLAMGTSVKFVPEGYHHPDSDEWILGVEFAAKLTKTEISVERLDPIGRYIHWLRFYACETGLDIALAQGLPLQLSGIREGEVDEVIESFRSLPERRPDPNGEAEAGSSNGHSDNRADRRRRSRA